MIEVYVFQASLLYKAIFRAAMWRYVAHADGIECNRDDADGCV